MTFEPTIDSKLVEIILSNPARYAMMTNDSAPPLEEFEVKPGNYAAVLCRADDGLLAGLFLLVPAARGSAEVHFCFVPAGRWTAIKAGRAFVEWVWAETRFHTLIGLAPSYNPIALRMAKACGFHQVLVEKEKGLKGGKPFDLIVTKIEKPS